MFVENHFQKDVYEIMRRDYLKTLTKDELRRSRVHCQEILSRFDSMPAHDRNQFIAAEIMGWSFRTENPHYYMTQEGYLRTEAFQPAEDLASAFLVFEYILIEDKTVLMPCGSGNGRYWAVYFEDVFLGVGKTKETAICKTSIIINDAVVMKMNTE
ncbi:hypothetical protein QP794_24365 [Paenibacillus sp. UMB7766-LJ446]|uniref:BC1872 family protein n=1 Tax=Paenibacillus sp. UMB7766-LJ446 TaxID=3046313 RepID=UPI00254B4AE2|nr:hypothetical protein [Paenibacillus sp. UMB7766-LJ446]MDK8193226.1 hypothetical protein [Paenibacillus sp. UMB7766-LJ446]